MLSRILSRNKKKNDTESAHENSRNVVKDDTSDKSSHTSNQKYPDIHSEGIEEEYVEETVGPSMFLGEYSYDVDTMKSRTLQASRKTLSLNNKVYRDVSATLGRVNPSLEVKLSDNNCEHYNSVIGRCMAFQADAVDIINLDNWNPNTQYHTPANIRHVTNFTE